MLNYLKIYKAVVEENRFLRFGEGYLYSDNDMSIFLNSSARIIFEFCDGERCVADIANEIKDIFSLPEVPLAHTEQCIKLLHSFALVVPCGYAGDLDRGGGDFSYAPAKAEKKSSILRSSLANIFNYRKSHEKRNGAIDSSLCGSTAMAVHILNDELKQLRELMQCEFLDLRSRVHVSGAKILAEENEFTPVYLRQDFKHPVFNPTVVPTFDGFSFIARCSAFVLYAENDWRGFKNTSNVIYRYDRNLSLIDSEMIDDSLVWHECKDAQAGFEDARAFLWRGSTWLLASGMSSDEKGESTSCQLLLKLDGNKITQCETLASPFAMPRERNWVPLVRNDRLFLVYSFVPTIVFEVMDNFSLKAVEISVQSYEPKDYAYSGGTPLVPFDGVFLGLVHDKRLIFDEKKYYTHRFVLVDADFKLLEISNPFFIQRKGIEFAVGLARLENSFILSYGVADRVAAFAVLTEKTIRKWLVEGAGRPVNNKRDDSSPMKGFVGRLGTSIRVDPKS